MKYLGRNKYLGRSLILYLTIVALLYGTSEVWAYSDYGPAPTLYIAPRQRGITREVGEFASETGSGIRRHFRIEPREPGPYAPGGSFVDPVTGKTKFTTRQ